MSIRRFLRRGGLFFRVHQLVVRLPLIFQRLERFRELHELRLARLFLFQRDAGLTHRLFGFSEGELCFPKFAAVFFVHRRFGRIGGQRIELFPDLRELFLPCVILRAVSFQQTGEKFRELVFRRKLGVLRQDDPCGVLLESLLHLVQFAADCGAVFVYPLLKLCIKIGFEYAAENARPLPRPGEQELAELSLREHGDLTELISVYTKDITNLFFHIRVTCEHFTVRQNQLHMRLFLGRSGPTGLGAFILRVSLDLIGLPTIGERKLHFGRRLGRGEFGTEHRAFASIAARFTEQRKGDRVKDRRLPCAGIARDEVQSAFAELPEIKLRFARIRTKGAERKIQRSHSISSRTVAKTSFTYSLCLSVIFCPFCISKNSAKSSVSVIVRRRSSAAITTEVRVRRLS